MTLNQKIIDIDGVSYAGRVTTGSLIAAERELKRPITKVLEDKENVGIYEISTILRFSLHPLNNPDQPISSAEWDKILNSEDTIGFMDACNAIMLLMAENIKARKGGDTPKN